MRRDRKGNPLKTPAVVRIVFLSLVAGLFAAAFVVIRNRHIKKGDEIREAETAILACDQEIALLENRIARLMGRADLNRHLRWIGSDLAEIEDSRVLKIYPGDELPALPKIASAAR